MDRRSGAVLGAVAWVCATAAAGQQFRIGEPGGTVSVPAVVAEQGRYKVLKGAIEYVVVAKGGKEYETIFTTECTPQDIDAALRQIGLRPGEPASGDGPPRGPGVRIVAEIEAKGKTVRRAVDEFVVYAKTGKPLEPQPWTFTGSTKAFDPASNKEVLQAVVTKSIVGLHYTDTSPLFQNPRAECRQENIYKANLQELPKAGTRVRLIFQRVVRQVAPGTRRVHVFVSGRVQGVGFRAFTQREARRRKLTGWVKNLTDGRVEAVIEGPREQVAALLARLRRGPRAARVERLDVTAEAPTGDSERFEIRY